MLTDKMKFINWNICLRMNPSKGPTSHFYMESPIPAADSSLMSLAQLRGAPNPRQLTMVQKLSYLIKRWQHRCWGVLERIEPVGTPESHANKEHSSSQQCVLHVGSESVPGRQDMGTERATRMQPQQPRTSPEVPMLLRWGRGRGQGLRRVPGAAQPCGLLRSVLNSLITLTG